MVGKLSPNRIGRAMSPLGLLVLTSLAVAVWPSPASIQTTGPVEFGGADLDHHDAGTVSPRERERINRAIAEYEARGRARTGGVRAPAGVQSGPQPYPFYPQAGTLWQDLFINNFVDRSQPSDPGVLDWDCTHYTYKGHTGEDTDISSFRNQLTGVPVFAALDGVVVDTHDGEFDMNLQTGDLPSNYVVLDHGNTHYTLYFHLQQGSIGVLIGDAITAGTQVGNTASSGSSTWPHLHFESRLNGTHYEPFAGPCRQGSSNWVTQVPIRRDLYVRDFTFMTGSPNDDPTFGFPWDFGPHTSTFVSGQQPVYFRLQLGNLPGTSSARFRLKRPDGTFSLDTNFNFPNSSEIYRSSWWWFWYNTNLDALGQWHLLIDVNGLSLLNAPFQVVSSPAEIVNRPPNAVSLSLEPTVLTPGNIILGRVQTSLAFRDPDYDAVDYLYQWTVNQTLVRNVLSAALSDVLPRGMVQAGDTVALSVTPYDGQAYGPVATASGVVQAGAASDVPRTVRRGR
jgi:murein DD-endopeptidase MepM/ murein hydrolase activator NlpD